MLQNKNISVSGLWGCSKIFIARAYATAGRQTFIFATMPVNNLSILAEHSLPINVTTLAPIYKKKQVFALIKNECKSAQ